MKVHAICVPGSVAPAAERYGPLQALIGDRAVLHLKDLEVYREARPPADYRIEQELEAIDRFADAPPPTGPPSPEMQKRPAGIAALIKAFDAHPFDRNLLRGASYPVFYAYGDLSHEEQALKAGILAQLFADIRVQRFAGVHHFVKPEQIYTSSHAESLWDLWQRGAALQLATA